ncbi:MAG: Group-1 luciferase family oxidoreductase [Candidatus Tokpelaia hoelldobleri]|uniref:Group-1 luciferase family oxidoreductase n=1 Tax=Candidatus Tokpelaia hoelldobleri TaxID=1902579 RepID=A0A1U9JT41_9HYPH|nr:MAG: Group-1 luciferase family oxidoreductase [Candidatus Tokpelaia hoelldoblerii]
MAYKLSLLDKIALSDTLPAQQALANTITYAQAAERAGFHRFWVAEHHHSKDWASSAPEALVSWLLAVTEKIRIGSGGVMLQHYSPYKVAEVFNVLAALAPDRVDLGVGKTPGGLPLASEALQLEFSDEKRLPFAEKAALLSRFLGGTPLEDGRFQGLAATPAPPVAPMGFLLGGSVDSALLAARLGWQLSYAGHLNGNEENLRKTIAAYKQATNGAVPQLALAAVIAPTREEALAIAETIYVYKVIFSDGKVFSLATQETAEEFARQSGRHDYRIEQQRGSMVVGTARDVSRELHGLHQRYGIEDFMLELPMRALEQRLQAIEALADVRLQLAA